MAKGKNKVGKGKRADKDKEPATPKSAHPKQEDAPLPSPEKTPTGATKTLTPPSSPFHTPPTSPSTPAPDLPSISTALDNSAPAETQPPAKPHAELQQPTPREPNTPLPVVNEGGVVVVPVVESTVKTPIGESEPKQEDTGSIEDISSVPDVQVVPDDTSVTPQVEVVLNSDPMTGPHQESGITDSQKGAQDSDNTSGEPHQESQTLGQAPEGLDKPLPSPPPDDVVKNDEEVGNAQNIQPQGGDVLGGDESIQNPHPTPDDELVKTDSAELNTDSTVQSPTLPSDSNGLEGPGSNTAIDSHQDSGTSGTLLDTEPGAQPEKSSVIEGTEPENANPIAPDIEEAAQKTGPETDVSEGGVKDSQEPAISQEEGAASLDPESHEEQTSNQADSLDDSGDKGKLDLAAEDVQDSTKSPIKEVDVEPEVVPAAAGDLIGLEIEEPSRNSDGTSLDPGLGSNTVLMDDGSPPDPVLPKSEGQQQSNDTEGHSHSDKVVAGGAPDEVEVKVNMDTPLIPSTHEEEKEAMNGPQPGSSVDHQADTVEVNHEEASTSQAEHPDAQATHGSPEGPPDSDTTADSEKTPRPKDLLEPMPETDVTQEADEQEFGDMVELEGNADESDLMGAPVVDFFNLPNLQFIDPHGVESPRDETDISGMPVLSAQEIATPEIISISEMFGTMKAALLAMMSSFDRMGAQAEKMAGLSLNIKAAEQLKGLKAMLEKQIVRQKREVDALRDMLQSKIKEAVEEKIRLHLREVIRETVKTQVEEKVRAQLTDQIPPDLRQQVISHQRQIIQVKTTLHNSEARMYNALQTIPGARLRPLLRPLPTPEQSPVVINITRSNSMGNSTLGTPWSAFPSVPAPTPIRRSVSNTMRPPGYIPETVPPTPSKLFPRDLTALFALNQEDARRLLRDYGLTSSAPSPAGENTPMRARGLSIVSEEESVEEDPEVHARDMNMFMAHIGVPFLMIPPPKEQPGDDLPPLSSRTRRRMLTPLIIK